MIEFIFGREATQRTEYIIEKMKKCLSENKKAVLLIPEHQALFWDTLTANLYLSARVAPSWRPMAILVIVLFP